MYLTIKTLFLFYKLFVEEQKKIHILKKGILAFTSPSCGCGALSDGHGRLHQTEPGVFRHQEEEMQEMCGDFFFVVPENPNRRRLSLYEFTSHHVPPNQ